MHFRLTQHCKLTTPQFLKKHAKYINNWVYNTHYLKKNAPIPTKQHPIHWTFRSYYINSLCWKLAQIKKFSWLLFLTQTFPLKLIQSLQYLHIPPTTCLIGIWILSCPCFQTYSSPRNPGVPSMALSQIYIQSIKKIPNPITFIISTTSPQVLPSFFFPSLCLLYSTLCKSAGEILSICDSDDVSLVLNTHDFYLHLK